MKKVLVLVVAMSLFGLGTAFAADPAAAPAAPAAASTAAPPPPTTFGVGATVSSLTAKNLAGEAVDLIKSIQKPYAIISFMNTACSACRVELKDLDKYTKGNEKTDFFVVSVDFAPEALEGYKKKSFLGGTWFHDPDFTIPAKFKITYTPGTVVLDKSGKVLALKSGWDATTGPAFIATLGDLLK